MGKPLGDLLTNVSTVNNTQNQTSFLSNLMNSLEGKGDLLSIIADQAGQRINPTSSNVFGGLGTSIAKSRMAGNQLAKDKSHEENLLMKVIQELRSPSGMNNAKISRDPKTGDIKVNTQTDIPKRIDDTLPEEKMVTADSNNQNIANQEPMNQNSKIGTMKDLFNIFK